MRKFRLLSLLLLAITFISVNCTKEGPEGPVGAAGPQGPPGSTGAPGAPGAPGATGTANVIYSDWYTTVAADWITTGADIYGASFLVNRSAPAITQSVIDNGIVLAYMKDWNHWTGTAAVAVTGEVAQLPFLENVSAADTYDFVIPSATNIRYLYKSLDPWSTAGLTGIQLRYVVIPGGIAGGKMMSGPAKGHTVDQLKRMSYEQITSMFKIPATGSNIR